MNEPTVSVTIHEGDIVLTARAPKEQSEQEAMALLNELFASIEEAGVRWRSKLLYDPETGGVMMQIIGTANLFKQKGGT